MAKLQASLRALVPHSRSLQELGNKMNQIICRDVSSESFASLIYFEIEAGSKTVKLLNAGHIPPVIIKNDKTLQLPHFSPALGLTKEAKYKEQIIELEKDEMMLLFSDGLSEARNISGELFSEEKIKELISKYKNLPLNSIGKNLVTDVEKFVGSERQSDDLSIILIKNLHE
jgi:sigma-B regulation protein RsbU (phosphoserine phosphatase)